MAKYLLLFAIVIIICVFFNKISSKLGIPTLLVFILLGMFFGTDGIVKIPFNDYNFAEQICSIALIFIMFYGGFGTKWSEAKPAATKAVLLSSVGVVMTAAITGLFCHFILKMDLMEGLLIGAVISSTDAASVFSILRSKRLNLKYNTASLLEVESGSNDPFAYMLTLIVLKMMNGSISAGSIIYMLFAQIAYGIIFGVAIALASRYLLKKFKFSAAGFDAIFVLAIAVLSYAAPAALGGNGYLSVYIVGIILGNSKIKNKQSLVHFFDGITGLMQMLLFFLLGLLATPSLLPAVALPALAIVLFLTFIARPVSVFAVLTPFKSKLNQQLLVSWAGLRGAASIVFAVMAIINTQNTQHDIFHTIFFIVLFSILVQGSLIPFAAKKLNMIDENADVMKTFNDYTDEAPVQFIRFNIPASHAWNSKKIKDVMLPPETLIALLIRNGEKLIPNGDTVLKENDALILSARATGQINGVHLTEKRIGEKDAWNQKKVSELNQKDMLIIMIQRDGKVVIPRGDTLIKENDVLVINHYE